MSAVPPLVCSNMNRRNLDLLKSAVVLEKFSRENWQPNTQLVINVDACVNFLHDQSPVASMRIFVVQQTGSWRAALGFSPLALASVAAGAAGGAAGCWACTCHAESERDVNKASASTNRPTAKEIMLWFHSI